MRISNKLQSLTLTHLESASANKRTQCQVYSTLPTSDDDTNINSMRRDESDLDGDGMKMDIEFIGMKPDPLQVHTYICTDI